jgi:hypothetical protein
MPRKSSKNACLRQSRASGVLAVRLMISRLSDLSWQLHSSRQALCQEKASTSQRKLWRTLPLT